MFAMGVTMYGQMTAGSYCYIGPQGIVHGTTVSDYDVISLKMIRSVLLNRAESVSMIEDLCTSWATRILRFLQGRRGRLQITIRSLDEYLLVLFLSRRGG